MTEGDSVSKASVGVSVGRLDGHAKVTGAALYLADLPPMEGELLGATVRSQVPRGVIQSIELDPDFDWSDVTCVLAEDVPDNVVQLFVDDQPILAHDRINHLYEPIALLACADAAKLARAVEAVKVTVDELPTVFDPAAAMAGEVTIWGDDNLQTRYSIRRGRADVEEGEVAIDAAIADCEVVVSGCYSTTHQEHVYIEPQGMVAWWDDEGVHAIGSMQCPYFVVKGMVRCFGLEPDRIHITQSVTGGAFGGKEDYPTLLACHAALAAKKAGRPVRMIYDRTEDIEATTKRHPSVTEVTTGCDRDGTLRCLKLRTVFDAGAYVTLTPVVLSRGVLHAGGVYKWEDAWIEGQSVATNTPPNGAFRGFGTPQTIWAIERHIDRVAREIGREPGDLKRQNLLGEGDSTPTGQVLRPPVATAECLDKAFAASDYARKRERGPVVAGRRARGIGCSVFLHGGGFTGSGEKRLKGKVAVDLQAGGRLLIRSASTEMGQGAETVLSQIAADAAGLALDRVSYAQPCTTHVPDSGPTVASRTTMVVGAIIQEAALEVAARVGDERRAGESWTDAADRLLAQEGEVTAMRQYEPPAWVQWDEDTYKGDAYPVFAWACDVAEVEVDLDTFEVEVVGFWIAADVGKAINPVQCKGQLEGGTLQAIGWALCEQVTWDGGRITNPRMTDYVIPTARDAPPFETILVESPYEQGPGGGAKGIGELPMDGGAPAIAAAVEHALGVAVDDLPLTPEHLLECWLAKQEAGR